MVVFRSSTLMRFHDFAGRSLLQNKLHKRFEDARKAHNVSWSYRKLPPEEPKSLRILEIFGGLTWWWITWHLVTDYKELLAHPFPDPSKWTDEELGIPPIEE